MKLAIFLFALLAGTARAQPETPRVAQARALFAQAEREWGQEHKALALQLFQQSYDLLQAEGHPRASLVLYNIGLAHEELGNWREAVRSYEQFLAASPPDPARVSEVQGRLSELLSRASLQRESLREPQDPAVTIVGAIGAGVGAVGLGVAWGMWIDLSSRNGALAAADPRMDGYLSLQSATDEAETIAVVAALSGGGVLSASLPMLLPREGSIPWWTWVAGGLALAATGAGVGLAVAEGGCIGQACSRREQLPSLGVLLLAHAAPLWSAFATGLVGGLLGGGSAQAWLGPSSGGLVLSWRTP
ncbi:MAG: tetratricopeptide repeat protein [Sandaracinaceae bacterium]|nr:tetratricopeptide repeat protein [Sandaracinaceae bacterium]